MQNGVVFVQLPFDSINFRPKKNVHVNRKTESLIELAMWQFLWLFLHINFFIYTLLAQF